MPAPSSECELESLLAWFGSQGNPWGMATAKQTKPWVRRFTSVLVGGGLAMATFGAAFGSTFGLAGGIGPLARAAPPPAPTNHWCPGDQWNPGWGEVYDWEWNHCHDWQGAAGQSGPVGWGPWGPPLGWAPPRPPQPSSAPGAVLMWNPTANVWGFWNNGIWTPA
jgi:hypothetical protein